MSCESHFGDPFCKVWLYILTGKQIGKYHRLQTKHNPKSDGIGNSFFLLIVLVCLFLERMKILTLRLTGS